jgi:hypothetical protein
MKPKKEISKKKSNNAHIPNCNWVSRFRNLFVLGQIACKGAHLISSTAGAHGLLERGGVEIISKQEWEKKTIFFQPMHWIYGFNAQKRKKNDFYE